MPYVNAPADLRVRHVYDATSKHKLDWMPVSWYVSQTDRADTTAEGARSSGPATGPTSTSTPPLTRSALSGCGTARSYLAWLGFRRPSSAPSGTAPFIALASYKDTYGPVTMIRSRPTRKSTSTSWPDLSESTIEKSLTVTRIYCRTTSTSAIAAIVGSNHGREFCRQATGAHAGAEPRPAQRP
ncbi:MAG: hypothetical protein MZV70_54260 [Desulfobacterales bacterium]|nr:hypothetical protein [Desulfobacterales bacterium]